MNAERNGDEMEAVLSKAALEGSSSAKESPVRSSKQADPRMHSAEHILTATLMAMLGCARPFTTHLEKKKSKADYHFARDLTADETNQVEARVNEVITRNLPVSEEFLARSQAEQLYDLNRLPNSAGETIRIVHIGDYDACPCSGNHVKKTSEIGRFRIISTTWESGALRVRFKLDATESSAQRSPDL